ncbi:MAG: hypothetical protein OXR03_24330 [Rhodospirillaceae bacterium]|nr:hypothetical protein [Rhodospirillaceae bacterium]
MGRKIEESFRHPVDGMPATRGTPLAAEARYYHSFFLAESSVSFDEFLAALSRELSSQFPGVTLNSSWIRACDQRGLIASARRDVSLLRASIEHEREFSVGVWELLWKITGTYIGKFGLTYAELKISESELQALAQRYLAAECRKRLRALDTLLQFSSLAAARRMFDIVDDMLHGVPTSLEEFAAEWQTQHAATGPYQAYKRAVAENCLCYELVGWSSTERNRIAALLYAGRARTKPEPVREGDPTAPALSDCKPEARIESDAKPQFR